MNRAHAPVLARLLRLRELRLRAAERILAEARDELDRRAGALAARQTAVAAVAADQATLEDWFQGAPDPRHLPSALHRRGALADRRAEAEAERDAAGAALDEARATHAATLADMTRARARRDMAQTRVADHRRAQTRREERAAEEDGEERAATRPRRGLALEGATA